MSTAALNFRELPIAGAYLVKGLRHDDERGWFTRTWSASEFAANGLDSRMAQSSLSFNSRPGTLRGLHYQVPPHAENKVVTCVRGTIWDVIVDVRSDSTTYERWHAEQLDANSSQSVYVPEGVAHGFLTLSEDVLVLYQMSTPFAPEASSGLRWDDPAFGITWPSQPVLLSERDRSIPNWSPEAGTSARSEGA